MLEIDNQEFNVRCALFYEGVCDIVVLYLEVDPLCVPCVEVAVVHSHYIQGLAGVMRIVVLGGQFDRMYAHYDARTVSLNLVHDGCSADKRGTDVQCRLLTVRINLLVVYFRHRGGQRIYVPNGSREERDGAIICAPRKDVNVYEVENGTHKAKTNPSKDASPLKPAALVPTPGSVPIPCMHCTLAQ